MWADPDTSIDLQKVYFNAFTNDESTFINPNVGLLGTRIMLEGFHAHAAFLGVWKDCNEDGYVGMVESIVTEYRSELLSETVVCPSGTEFNRDGWVYEFRWIGPGDNVLLGEGGTAQRLIDDREAYVWGDPGLPGEPIAAGCWLNPPTGTFSSTGAFLAWADCNADHGVARLVSETDPTGLLTFGDTPEAWEQPQCSDSLLDQPVQLFADDPKCPHEGPGAWDDTSDPAVTVFDCDEATLVEVRDPSGLAPTRLDDPTGGEGIQLTDGTGAYANLTLAAPAPSVGDPRGSYYATANETVDAATGCTGGSLTYATPETPVTSGGAKRETTLYFWFSNDFGSEWTFGAGRALDPAMPAHAGVGYLNNGNNFLGPSWASPVMLTDSVLLRGDLQPAGAAWYTYYARIGTDEVLAAVQLPTSSIGVYGAEWCDGAQSGVVDGFDCDASKWWRPEHGASAMPTQSWTGRPIGQAPGATYQLRDIDCYDGTLAGPVRLGLADLSEEGPCPTV